MTELLQIMVARRGVLIYRTAECQKLRVVANRSLRFRHDRQGRDIQIGAALLLPPRLCVSLVWRRP
jgi:hypothetical protein